MLSVGIVQKKFRNVRERTPSVMPIEGMWINVLMRACFLLLKPFRTVGLRLLERTGNASFELF